MTKKEFVHFSAKRGAHKIQQSDENQVFWNSEVEVVRPSISPTNQNFGLQSVSFHSVFQQFTDSKMYQKSSFLTKKEFVHFSAKQGAHKTSSESQFWNDWLESPTPIKNAALFSSKILLQNGTTKNATSESEQ